MKKTLSIVLIGLLTFSMLSVLTIMPVSAAVDEYFIYSKFDPPGISDVTAAGGYVEYYGVPEWGDEIQYVYFLSGNTGYKMKVWVTDGDGDGKIEPRQHPNHYLSEYQGPIEPRHFQIVSSKDLTGYTYGSGGHTEEFYVDSSGVYLGAYPYGIHKWDHDWNFKGKIANSPPSRCESMAYNPAENTWYAGDRYRTIYQMKDTDNDGSFMDESWVSIFTYPSYAGDHHDGMEYVGGYLWISDMTSDVIGKWQYNPSSGIWEELKRFTYSEPGDVEGMGFGPNDHFWVGSGWGSASYIYELGNEITRGYPIADAGPDVNAHPPTVPVKFDASGSHHTDPAKQIILYEWDFENDGALDYSGTDLIVEHTYPAYYNPDGSIDWAKTAKDHTATLRVTDNSDPPLQNTDTRIVHITAPPWKPVANPDGPYEGYTKTRVQLDGSKSFDPESVMFSPDHPWYETIATYEWDLDYDGQFDDATGAKPTYTWDNEGLYIIGLNVTDSQPSGPGGTIGPLDFDIKYTTVVIEKQKFILIPSEEDTWPRKPTELTIKREVTHILALNIMDPIDETKSFQERINTINDQGGTAIIAHPKTNLIDERKFTGYVGLEIYNPKAPFGLATDEWDNVLHTKRRVWGFATDDAHEISDFGKAWIMLQAPTLTMNSILDSVKEGNLYATSGPLIEKISAAGNTISIKLPEEMNVNVYRFYYSWGWLHDEVYRTTAKELDYTVEYKRFRVGSNDGYVRIEVHSKDGKSSAWTQPFEIDNLANIVNNPYETSGTWYKGQLHCHSTGSDGELTPEEVVNWYMSNGYHFLAITDHNRITEPGNLRMTTKLEIDAGGVWQKASVKVVDWESVPVKGVKVTGWWEWDGNIREEEPEVTNDDGEVVFHLVEPLLPGRTYTFEFVIKGVTKTGWQWDGGDVRKSVTVGLLEPREAAKKATIMLSEHIQFLPSDAFHHSADTTEQRKNALYEKLITNDDGDAVLQLIAASKYQDAINKLQNDIRAKMDGDSTAKDWITNPEAQQELCSMIDSLVACLRTLL